MLRAIWETTKLSSCARKLGSSELMNSPIRESTATASQPRRARGSGQRGQGVDVFELGERSAEFGERGA